MLFWTSRRGKGAANNFIGRVFVDFQSLSNKIVFVGWGNFEGVLVSFIPCVREFVMCQAGPIKTDKSGKTNKKTSR